ncbi:MAG: FGGY-family carbohydrate kinase [Chloroflexota bacterium]|nr:MAG: hypothetical protein DLM70_16905 [Chloroflexota bacterium]
MGRLVLSLDLGTSSLKVGLFGVDGELRRAARREQQLFFPPADRVEQSPASTWRALAEAVREATVGERVEDIAAIALSTQRGTVVPLSDQGEPLSNLVVWMDKRGVPWVDWLQTAIGTERYYTAAGHPLVSYTGVSKVLWFRRESPLWERTVCIGPPQTLFLRWLGCEDFVCDRSSGTFHFPFDIDRQTWSTSLAACMDVPLDRLPHLVSSIDIAGQLSASAAADLGLQAGIPLAVGGGDGQLAALGCGVTHPGVVMVNIGTAAGVQIYLPSPIRDPRHTLNLAAHAVAGAWEMEGHTQSSGVALRWFRDEFGEIEQTAERESGLDAYDALVAQASNVLPGAEGLLFLPYFNGSAGPMVDLQIRACILGMSLAHKRAHVIRAVLEGISLEIRWMLDAMLALSGEVEEVRLVGGGARNDTWNQMHADILHHPVRILQVPDAAMVGAAMCAAVAIGEYADLTAAARAFVHPGERIEPDEARAAVYELVNDRFREAFRLVSNSGLFPWLQTAGDPLPAQAVM